MSKSSIPAEYRTQWLEAVRLPGVEEARESCLQELSEYTGAGRDEVLARCQGAVEAQRDLWHAAERESREDLQHFYNDCDAYVYELLWWHALEQGDAPAWNARLVDIARRFAAKRYLDFGAGIGTNAILLARQGLDVTLADISTPLLECARWRLERRGLKGTFVDLKSETLPNEGFDMISAVDVLEHVYDALDTLEHLHALLRPGGVLVFDLIASKPDPERPFHLLRSKYPIRSQIRGMGFRYVEKFQKYLVFQKAARPPLGDRVVRGWDSFRWRLYYLMQGKWPRYQRPSS